MTTTPNYDLESAILGRVVDSARSGLSPEMAHWLLALAFSEADVEKMNQLAQKSQDGVLSLEEHSELDSYLRVGRLLALLQAKARRATQQLADISA